mgnify:CR=1 FL=1
MKAIRILAAIDRFPEDDAVLLRGIEVAARHGVALTIVHVVDLPDHAASAALITTFRGQAEFAARDRIEAALRRHGVDPAEIGVCIDTGVPAERLIELCKELEPMLVVMRAHHKPWIVTKLLGSTTEKVMAAGHAPVLVVKPAVDKPYGRVLLAIDGPDTAPTALSFVTALLPDAKVHMVQAVAVTPQLEQAMLRVGLARMEMRAHHDVLAQDAEARLRSLAAELSPGVTWQVLRGDPAQELARATHAPDVDLIALGPNRSGLLRRVFIGGVTRQLLRNAGCDVLIGRLPATQVPDAVPRRDPAVAHSAGPMPPLAI